MPLMQRTSDNTWKQADVYVKTGTTTWTVVPQIYVKTANSTWSPLYEYKWNPGEWGACDKVCGGGTQTRAVPCIDQSGRTVPDSYCTKHAGTKPITTQMCNTQECNYWVLGGADDRAMLYTLTSDNRWRCIMARGGGDRPPVYNQVTAPEFANETVYMLFAMTDTNGTSYSASLQMCTAQNVCTDRIVYWGKKSECDGGTWYFTWHIPSMTTTRHRATGWRHRNQNQCSGCSGATDSGWGYLNCASGGPSWAYIPIPWLDLCPVGSVG